MCASDLTSRIFFGDKAAYARKQSIPEENTLRARIYAASAASLALFLACTQEATTPVAAAEPAPQAATSGYVDKAPTTIKDFTLTDHAGKQHRLYDLASAKAVVITMQGVGCPIVQKMTPDLKSVQTAYEAKGVKFLMLNSNIQDNQAMIAGEVDKFDIKIPVLKDADQKVARSLNVERTAETFVIDPKGWKIVYHGPLNDRLTYGRERAQAQNHFVSQTLDGVLSGKPVNVVRQQADGCIINFVENPTGKSTG